MTSHFVGLYCQKQALSLAETAAKATFDWPPTFLWSNPLVFYSPWKLRVLANAIFHSLFFIHFPQSSRNMSGKESKLYACSKCFTRHPFEELSQGQQLCKVNQIFNLLLKYCSSVLKARFLVLIQIVPISKMTHWFILFRNVVETSRLWNVLTAELNFSRKGIIWSICSKNYNWLAFVSYSKSKTSSICKKCEQNVAQFGKPTSCQFCQLPAAFVGGKCQRCSSYYKRYGPPKTCDQCKQKSAFDRGVSSLVLLLQLYP